MADLKNILLIVCIICCVIGIILAIALPLASLETLEATEMGLDYDGTMVEINENKLYTAGRHFIGLTHDFIVFPLELQDISFSEAGNGALMCRTKDGLPVTINLSFQYSLLQDLENIVALFYNFERQYPTAFAKIARNVLRDAVSNFLAFDMVYNRIAVEQLLRTEISTSISRFGAIVQNFQLLDITFPIEFSSSIQNTQNEILKIDTANNTKIRTEKDVEGRKARAREEAKAIKNEFDSLVIVLNNDASATADAIRQRVDALQNTLPGIKTNLGMDETQISEFQWISSLTTISKKIGRSRVNLGTPNQIKCFNDPILCP